VKKGNLGVGQKSLRPKGRRRTKNQRRGSKSGVTQPTIEKRKTRGKGERGGGEGGGGGGEGLQKGVSSAARTEYIEGAKASSKEGLGRGEMQGGTGGKKRAQKKRSIKVTFQKGKRKEGGVNTRNGAVGEKNIKRKGGEGTSSEVGTGR